ncbi:MAG: hypothetical protein M3070_02860, partial [Actinomycetota bacterium]|nr:hypothetical protein [Actinomycetota bacterium]
TAIEEALTELRPTADADTVLALSDAAGIAAFSGDPSARVLADEALGLGQDLDVAPALLARLFITQSTADAFAQRLAQSAALLGHAAALAQRAGDRQVQGLALLNLSATLLASDFPAAAPAAQEAADLCRLIGNRSVLDVSVANLGFAHLCSGDWDAALAAVDTAVTDDGLDGGLSATLRAMLLGLRGDPAGAAMAAELPDLRASDNIQDIATLVGIDATLATAEGRPRDALQALTSMFAPGSTPDLGLEHVFWAWPIAARAALEIGDHAEARRLVALLDDRPVGHLPALLRANLALARARLAAVNHESTVDDDPSEDVDRMFAHAITALRAAGSPYHLAHGLLDHATHLRTHGRDDTAARDEAATIGQRLHAVEITRRAAEAEVSASVIG